MNQKEGRTLKRDPCQNIKGSKEWLKLFCISSGHDLTTIKPKTTNFYLSRNSRSNSASPLLPPKCSEPKISKLPCIRLGNEKCLKKVSSNETKTRQDPSKHQN